MNTTMYDPVIDKRFEGEDAADALFASMLLEPPQWLDERILSIAHNAAREEEEFSRLEQLSDAMFAKLMVEPPAYLDQQIMAKAKEALIPKPTLVDVIINGINFLAEKIFMPDGKVIYSHNRTYAFALAAEQEDEQDQQIKRMRDCVLYGESKVEYELPGEWSLHVSSDPFDPNRRYIQLYFSGMRKEVYEGFTVKLTGNNGEELIFGIIEDGQVEAELPPYKVFGPPFTLQVQLQNVQEK